MLSSSQEEQVDQLQGTVTTEGMDPRIKAIFFAACNEKDEDLDPMANLR